MSEQQDPSSRLRPRGRQVGIPCRINACGARRGPGPFLVPAAALLLLLAFAVPGLGNETAPPPAGPRTVVLDPGHGGEDTGGRGTRGTLEKQVTLSLAEAIRRAGDGRYFFHVTRTGDYDLPLFERSAAANRHGAAAMVSLHTGVGLRHATGGLDIFYAAQTEAAAAEPGRPANWRGLQSRHRGESRRLALLLQMHLADRTGTGPVRVDAAPLAVLAGVDAPAVLLETGYITHPDGEDRLRDPAHLKALAGAVVAALDDYFQNRNPISTTDLRE